MPREAAYRQPVAGDGCELSGDANKTSRPLQIAGELLKTFENGRLVIRITGRRLHAANSVYLEPNVLIASLSASKILPESVVAASNARVTWMRRTISLTGSTLDSSTYP